MPRRRRRYYAGYYAGIRGGLDGAWTLTQDAFSSGARHDTHGRMVAPQSFRQAMDWLAELGVLPLTVASVRPTRRREFSVALAKPERQGRSQTTENVRKRKPARRSVRRGRCRGHRRGKRPHVEQFLAPGLRHGDTVAVGDLAAPW
ncbi:hypothetical protein GCM10010964_26010 [Caldovatus sediminis]|uniref:Uncharacterized protein n=1 Tax=Caldovatus sediminis TaxID=2041189 RepID=A0A8J3EBG8_9PROT|nr:hypothetical protein GCM10010964_26010 [Caldovatus sediminis]